MYLEPADLIDLNRVILETTRFVGDRPHGIQVYGDIVRCVELTRRHFHDDPFKRATLLCCALVAHHPFRDANHRTSLHAAILQLMLDGYYYVGTPEAEKELYRWRYQYEREHLLESNWAYRLGSWDDPRAGENYLLGFVETEYGLRIEQYLRHNCHAMPLSTFIAALPTPLFLDTIRRYGDKAFRKEARRIRRAKRAQWSKLWKEYERRGTRTTAPRPPRQRPWVDEDEDER